MKKSIAILLIFLILVLIYVKYKDSSKYYVILGNKLESSDELKFNKYLTENNICSNYITMFLDKYIRTTDIINDINNNKSKNGYNINNVLIKADVTILNVGFYDYINYLDNIDFKNNVLKIRDDMDELIKIIRRSTKEDIILIGVTNYENYDNEKLNIINNIYINLCKQYNIYYLDMLNNTDDDISDGLINLIENAIIR